MKLTFQSIGFWHLEEEEEEEKVETFYNFVIYSLLIRLAEFDGGDVCYVDLAVA